MLRNDGHEVVVHARNTDRLTAGDPAGLKHLCMRRGGTNTTCSPAQQMR
jgi:hypothetical protein